MARRFKQPIWIVPLIVAGLVALTGWWGNARLRETIRQQLRAKLASTLDANVAALGIWTTNQMRIATSLAEQPELKTIALRILDQPPPPPGERGRRVLGSPCRHGRGGHGRLSPGHQPCVFPLAQRHRRVRRRRRRDDDQPSISLR